MDRLPFSLARQWTPNGETKMIPQKDMKITHYPKEGTKSQRIVIEHGGKIYTQYFQNKKWSDTYVRNI